MNNEFEFLKNEIDYDQLHVSKLEPVNNLCRYGNILPYKKNKVILQNNRFINASWIHMPYHQYFIATQGPLINTVEDFWTMVSENNTKVIVMLCDLNEKGVPKCHNYWDQRNKMKDFFIELKNEEQKKDQGLVLRKFQITTNKTKNQNDVFQIHFTKWADHSVPTSAVDIMLEIIKYVNENIGGFPAIVHCSAGVGRTGTFIAIYNLFVEIAQQIRDNKQEKYIKFSIFNTVRKLKEMRLFSVENFEQYAFIYQFVNEILIRYNDKK